MTVTIYQGPSFGHAVELVTETVRRPKWSTHDSIGSWRGVGVPEELLAEMQMAIRVAFEEHVITRYGVAPQLSWEDEVGPF